MGVACYSDKKITVRHEWYLLTECLNLFYAKSFEFMRKKKACNTASYQN